MGLSSDRPIFWQPVFPTLKVALAIARASMLCPPDRLELRHDKALGQLRQKTQDAQGPHTLRIHLKTLDQRTTQIYTRPNPSNAGTKHLEPVTSLVLRRLRCLRRFTFVGPIIQPSPSHRLDACSARERLTEFSLSNKGKMYVVSTAIRPSRYQPRRCR